MLKPWPRTLLGGVVGLTALIAMIRLVGAGFPGNAALAMSVVGLAMVPWVLYVGWRARHGRLAVRPGLAVALLTLLGLIMVWVATIGPVLALAASLAGFVIIWVHDLPERRRPTEKLVRIDEISRSED